MHCSNVAMCDVAHLRRLWGCVTGGGGGQSQRREGELDGIDQDFDETQVEVKMAGKQAYPSVIRRNTA